MILIETTVHQEFQLVGCLQVCGLVFDVVFEDCGLSLR